MENKHIEALEKIAKYKNKSCQGCGADEYSMLRARIGILTKTIEAIKGIATQALAEQECNVTKCAFYQEGYCAANLALHDKNLPLEYHNQEKCKNNPSCYYKQLRSQQKTFTVEEVRIIIKLILNTYTSITDVRMEKNIQDWVFENEKWIINKFKKEVE